MIFVNICYNKIHINSNRFPNNISTVFQEFFNKILKFLHLKFKIIHIKKTLKPLN